MFLGSAERAVSSSRRDDSVTAAPCAARSVLCAGHVQQSGSSALCMVASRGGRSAWQPLVLPSGKDDARDRASPVEAPWGGRLARQPASCFTQSTEEPSFRTVSA